MLLILKNMFFVHVSLGQICKPQGRELVLDYIVERKRMDDLVSSTIDGRFREQKVNHLPNIKHFNTLSISLSNSSSVCTFHILEREKCFI